MKKTVLRTLLIITFLYSCNNESGKDNNVIPPTTKILNELTINYDSIYFIEYWRQFKPQISENEWNKIQSSLLVYKEFNVVDTIKYPTSAKTCGELIWFSKDFYTKSNSNSLRQFALEFNNQFQLPILNNNIKNDIVSLRNSNKHDLEKYVSLILLKLYKSHLTCCSQGYNIGTGFRNTDSIFRPIQYEFCQFSPSENIEGLHSGAVYAWVKQQKKLLTDSLIRQEINEIDKLVRK